jgi:NAD(P)-dependent dehydrogenase (short-subunit alcohol dehydrogenase family)
VNAPRCLVLGGSGYVGEAVCRMLARRGARVAFTYLTRESKARALESALPGAKAWRVDLRDRAAVEAMVRGAAGEWGGLEALIQCAGTAGDASLYRSEGLAPPRKFLAIGEPGWDDMLDVTVKGTFLAVHAAVPLLKAGGQVVLVGAMDGVKMVASPVHYAAAKGALKGMVQALAKELGDIGICVNMVAPGILDGGMGKLLAPDLLAEYLKHCSLKRLGTAEEVAEWAAWLALENTFVNGQAVLLDGGL